MQIFAFARDQHVIANIRAVAAGLHDDVVGTTDARFALAGAVRVEDRFDFGGRERALENLKFVEATTEVVVAE